MVEKWWIYAHEIIVVIGWVANESYVMVEDGVIIRAWVTKEGLLLSPDGFFSHPRGHHRIMREALLFLLSAL